MSIAPGTTLGRYQILEPLGQGGMATVYRSYQPALDRHVALKVIRRGFAEDPEFRERFQREARTIARLTHRNVIQVFDYDEVDGQLFLAMQYVDGGTLKRRLTELARHGTRLPHDEIARIVLEVAAALTYAHGRAVIHRDVKPSNVMLASDGSVVVTDFGIAKIVGGTQHTATGVGIGTPEYMSPEQGQGLPLDGRTDEYAATKVRLHVATRPIPNVSRRSAIRQAGSRSGIDDPYHAQTGRGSEREGSGGNEGRTRRRARGSAARGVLRRRAIRGRALGPSGCRSGRAR